MFSIMHMIFLSQKSKFFCFNNAFDEMPSIKPCHAHT
jgi:hypothetical protein